MLIGSPCRSDTVRYALDILSILTVVPKTQLLLSEAVAVLDEGGSTVSTVGQCPASSAEDIVRRNLSTRYVSRYGGYHTIYCDEL